MDVTKVEYGQKRNTHHGLMAASGAVAGTAARYFLPSTKGSADSFLKNASNRASDRSILKYSGIGALVALGLSFIVSKLSSKNDNSGDLIQYSKYGAVIDAPADSAYAIIYYNA